MSFVRVAALSALPPGSLLGVEVDGRPVCLANVNGKVFAFQDNCTHEDFPLHNGTLEGKRIECAWHGAQFDVESGRAVRLPAVKPLQTYEVTIEGDDILVAI